MVTFDDLPTVFYSAHRGGAGEAPENTLEALRAAKHWAEVLDLDTQVLGDGTPVLMHDVTVDRTTTGTGPVTGYNAAQWQMLRSDPAAWFAAGCPQLAVPTVAQALDEFGGRRVLSVEAKNAAGVSELAASIRDRGLVESVLINTNDPDVVPTIRAAGCRAHLWRSAAQMAGDDFTALVGAGADVLDVDQAAADNLIRAAVAAVPPLGVWAHTVVRRSQRDRLVQLGCRGIVTDHPGYVTRRPPPRTSDSLTAGWGYGYVPTAAVGRPKLLAGGVLHFTSTADTQALLLGELSPVAAPSFTVEAKFSLSSATSRPWFGLHLGLDDADAPLKSAAVVHDGYSCQFTGGGNLAVYRDDGATGVSTKLASVAAGGTFAADTAYTLRVTVTPTQIRLTVPELSAAVAVADDSRHRGPLYLYLGRAASSTGATAKAWDITAA
ncbi:MULTISPECIES: glycerophosphodiester phosphodiesterase [unclassified Streptomyces]|uniref:glycerophosphodiester phosphodiesterase n=1 Tax=unclassified Streptomyces TaxID=2593676 RepID=UPI0036E71E28